MQHEWVLLMTENYKKKSVIIGFTSLHWMHWLVIVASLALTIGAWYISKEQIEEKVAQKFDNESRHVMELVIERMQKYEDALWGGVAAVHSQGRGIDSEEWRKYASVLRIDKKYPGINGIGIIHYVVPERLDDYLAEERKLREGYNVHPDHDRDEHWPITYIEPADLNAKAVGLDIAHEENRLSAAKKARDTGTAQITAPITLVQDSRKTPGFLFYAPFYDDDDGEELKTVEQRQDKFIGLVYAPFITNKLMEGTLQNNLRLVNVRIGDTGTVVYDELKAGEEDYDSEAEYKQTNSIDMYGRPWTIEIQAAKSFRESTESSQPMIILIGGAIVDILLFVVFLMLTRSNKHAARMAGEMTEELREARAFQDLIIESIPDYFFVKDEDFKFVRVNSRFLTLFPEAQRNKVVGYTKNEKFAPEEVDEYLKKDREAFEKGSSETIEVITFPDGKTRSLHTTKISFENSLGKKFILGIARDVTEREKLLEKLLGSNTELERFAYVASHDMQEPLRMITNFSEIIHDDYADKLDEEGTEYLKIIRDSGQRMQAMINDLLEYSRVEGASTMPMEFDGNIMLEGAISNVGILIEESGAEITHEKMPKLIGNKVQIARVIQNLITNSIKYQPEGNSPKIYIDCEDMGNCWKINVKDNGIGIAPEYIDKIFTPFRRLHNYNAVSGSGLGLSICKKIIDNHSGEFTVTSKVEVGTTFSFTLTK